MRRAIALLVGLGIATTATAARKSATTREPDAQPVWEQPGGRAKARMELAEALLEAGSVDACLKLIAQMRTENVRGVDIERLHARALRSAGLDDDAQDVLQQIVRRWPRDAASHNELGILAMDRKQVDVAVEHFATAARIQDGNADYLNNLGFAQLSQGQHDAAVGSLRRALRADSSRDQTRNNLGFALVAAGRSDEAFRVFRAAGTSADAHYNVGVGLELSEDADGAVARFEKALSVDPSHPGARTALARLTPIDSPADPPAQEP